MAQDFNVEDMVPSFGLEAEDGNEENIIIEPIPPNEGMVDPETLEEGPQMLTDEEAEELEEPETGDNPTPPATPEEGEEDPGARGTYETLIEAGILQDNEEFDGTFGYIEDQLKGLPQAVADSLVAQAPDVGQNLISYIFTKGQDLTTEDLATFMQEHMSDFVDPEAPNFDDVDVAFKYIENRLKETTSEKRAKLMAEAILEDGDEAVKEEAQNLFEKAQAGKSSKSSQRLEQEKQAKAQREQAQREFAESVFAEIDGTDWKSSKKNQLKRAVSNDIHRDVLSAVFESPKGFAQMADFLTYFDKKTKEFNFDKFIESLSTGEVQRLKGSATSDRWSSAGAKGSSKGGGKARGGSASNKYEMII